MKKLILLALAVGAGVLAKNKSQQLKAGANKVAQDPRVQSALATAQEKAGPYADAVKDKVADATQPVSDETAVSVDASEPGVDDLVDDGVDDASDFAPDPVADPLTDPLPDDERP